MPGKSPASNTTFCCWLFHRQYHLIWDTVFYRCLIQLYMNVIFKIRTPVFSILIFWKRTLPFKEYGISYRKEANHQNWSVRILLQHFRIGNFKTNSYICTTFHRETIRLTSTGYIYRRSLSRYSFHTLPKSHGLNGSKRSLHQLFSMSGEANIVEQLIDIWNTAESSKVCTFTIWEILNLHQETPSAIPFSLSSIEGRMILLWK